MKPTLRILAIGDVVGPNAVTYLAGKLWAFRKEEAIDFVVCNAENAAPGNGLDKESAERLLAGGCDVLTGGNHSFRRREIFSYYDDSKNVIRPANFPAGTAGYGSTVVESEGKRILVVNVQGTVYMEPLACPFEAVEKILRREEGQYDFALLDIHAEATSEKIALAHAFDGRFAAIFGTHTHVPTADTQILPKGSGYVTDLGMTGAHDGALGVKTELVIEKLKTKMPVRFELSDGKPTADGVIFEIDASSFKCLSVKRAVL